MPQDYVLSRLFDNNVQWAEDMVKKDPDFFVNSALVQKPKVVWIGCADSRVPESVITASLPGEIFVQRNIANQLPLDDNNALSVLTYGVELKTGPPDDRARTAYDDRALGASHVVIVGHTNCGGVAAAQKAVEDPDSLTDLAPELRSWLGPLVELAHKFPCNNDLTALIEENVRQQVRNAVRSDAVQAAWAAGHLVEVHGWVYELETGLLRDLRCSVGKGGPLSQ